MNNDGIIFSILTPTYNSQKTLRYTLDSIKKQNFDLSRIECLILDGGSTDNTLQIAKQYDFVRIIENKDRLPENAKLLGYQHAKGKYVIKLDSDESFASINTLLERYTAFQDNKDVHLLVANTLKYIPGYGFSGYYLNSVGDPFTYFIYRPQKTIKETYRKNIISSSVFGPTLLHFCENDIRPIADGGSTTFDLEYAAEKFPQIKKNLSAATSISDLLFDDNGYCMCIPGEIIEHRSRSDLKSYLNKINFRVVNNVFGKNEAGFSNRKVSSSFKKYLFPLYTLSFIFPLFDAIKLSIEYNSGTMLMHVFYCYYTLGSIGINIFKKVTGKNPDFKRY